VITYRLLALHAAWLLWRWVRCQLVPTCLHVIGAMLVLALVGAAVLRVLLSSLAAMTGVMP